MTKQRNDLRTNRATSSLEPVDTHPPDLPGSGILSMRRRQFLEASGFALFLSAVAGCMRAPVRHVVSSVTGEEDAAAGLAQVYSSTCGGCSAACGVLVTTRDGRPIKLEGNPDHSLSRGGLCAVGQAEVLGLYDSQRLRGPKLHGDDVAWPTMDGHIRARLAAARKANRAVVLLTGTVHSPTTKAVIAGLLDSTPNARHVTYDSLSASAIASAHERTHGQRIIPHYRFDRADVIVSLGADFLGTWISPVEYTAGYNAKRVPVGDPAEMSYHLQIESRMSLTGSNADERWSVAPNAVSAVAGHLAVELAARTGHSIAGSSSHWPVPRAKIERLADRLWQARGRALAVCDSQDVHTQMVCNAVNDMLEAYGNTIDTESASLQRLGNDVDIEALIKDLEAGRVGVLVIAGANPLYDLPEAKRLEGILSGSNAPTVVRITQHIDETAVVAECLCPESHWLESWGDAEPAVGVLSICQPTIARLGSTRTLLECLLAWTDDAALDELAGYHAVKSHWQDQVYSRRSEDGLSREKFWEDTLRRGVVELPASSSAKTLVMRQDAQQLLADTEAVDADERLWLVLYPKTGLLDGRTAHNPWLQELPDPVSKATWDNYACLSAETAARLGVGQGEMLRVTSAGRSVELPTLIQAGQHDNVVAVALGYGRVGTQRFAKIGPQWIEARPSVGPNGLVGVNAAPLLGRKDGLLQFVCDDVAVEVGKGRRLLATTQRHHSLSVPEHLATPGTEYRPIVEQTTLGAYRENPEAGTAEHHHFEGKLWPDDHPYTGRRWAMVIDLNRCTGCSACVIACQAENNVPVVGRDEVLRSREMHWIRIDRYYTTNDDETLAVHQPMMCHHCANAPCENVCPVLATVHSKEGLNQQVYNRCVGTRYCANNCPYKVRRFNWFEYGRGGRLENAALNPDITVRSRGVMEKCSFCVQRIHEATLLAKQQDIPLADGAVRTACQQSCPAGAIIFGDLNDPDSAVAKAAAQERTYQVLSELNVRPSVAYLRVVRNCEEPAQEIHHG